MHIFKKLIIAIVALLSLAAGFAKILQSPQEAIFFQSLGLGTISMIASGIIQLVSATFLIPFKTRKWGAVLSGISFFISTIMIFMNGQIGFGVFSLLPVFLAVWIFITSKP